MGRRRGRAFECVQYFYWAIVATADCRSRDRISGENRLPPATTHSASRPDMRLLSVASEEWTRPDLGKLRKPAKENTPTRVMGVKLGRTEDAVRAKASEKGISLKPANQSPYNRRKR